jgi:hypothetical protein
MRMENLVEWWFPGETEVFRENLPQCHFIYHKSHMTWPGANPGRRSGKPAINNLSYGTAISVKYILILSFHLRLDLPYGFPTKIPYAFLFFAMRATFPVHLIIHDLVILIIFGEEYKLRSPSQWARGLRREMSSPSWALGSWIRIPLEAWISVCVYFVCADPPSEESYRLCKGLRNWKSGQGTTKGCTAIDEWMRIYEALHCACFSSLLSLHTSNRGALLY